MNALREAAELLVGMKPRSGVYEKEIFTPSDAVEMVEHAIQLAIEETWPETALPWPATNRTIEVVAGCILSRLERTK